jgi:SAM-dependent methyltransferase
MTVRQPTGCPCCGEHDVRWLGKLQDSRWFAGRQLDVPLLGGDLYRCRRCQLKFRHPIHDDATYQRLYDNAVISRWPADVDRPDWDLIVDHIENELPRGGRVLDFGCYSGGLLARLNSVYERYGVEVNRAAAAVAAETANAQVWSRIDDVPRALRFDVVVAVDVIEHVANPLYTVSMLMTLLTRDGVLIITTGDADNFLWNRFGANWWYCYYPEHIAFVSEAWFDHFSEKGRWTVARCTAFRRTPTVRYPRIATALMYCYGWFPALCVFVVDALKKILRRSGGGSVPGNGLSADHLLVALTRRD